MMDKISFFQQYNREFREKLAADDQYQKEVGRELFLYTPVGKSAKKINELGIIGNKSYKVSSKHAFQNRVFKITINYATEGFHPRVLHLLLDYWLGVAKAFGAKMILVRHDHRKFAELKPAIESYGFVHNDDMAGITGWGYTQGKMTEKGNSRYFLNLESSFMQRTSDVFANILDTFSEYTKKDKTIEVRVISSGPKALRRYKYYYRGFEGDLHLLVTDEGFELAEYKLDYRVTFKESSEVRSAIQKIMSRTHDSTVFPSLLNPPRKHFNAQFKNPMLQDHLLSQMFNHLLKHYEGHEIERRILEEKPLMSKKRSIVIVSVFDYLFVLDSHHAYEFHKNEKVKAYDKFRELVIDEVKDNIEIRVENFDLLITS